MKKQYVAHHPHSPGQGSFTAPVPIYGQASVNAANVDFNVAVPFTYYKLAAISVYVRALTGSGSVDVNAVDISAGTTNSQIAATATALAADKLIVFHADPKLAGTLTVGSADFAVSSTQQLTFASGNVFSTVADSDLGSNSGQLPHVFTTGISTGESATLDIVAWIIPVTRF